jgi:hypothetical protein
MKIESAAFAEACKAGADVFLNNRRRTRAERIEADLWALVKACEVHGFFNALTEQANSDLAAEARIAKGPKAIARPPDPPRQSIPPPPPRPPGITA